MGGVARWRPPSFDVAQAAPDAPEQERQRAEREVEERAMAERAAADQLAAELASLRAAARAEGFTEGERAGRAAADAVEALRVQERAAAFAALTASLAAKIDSIDTSLAEASLRIVDTVARAVIGQLAVANGDVVRGLVLEAMGVLGEDLASASLRLHPDDAALLGDALVQSVHADPGMHRGCVVLTAGHQHVDVDLQARLERALTRVHTRCAPAQVAVEEP